MGRRSTLDTLPKAIRDAVEAALEEGATIDDVTGKLAELGHERSRSAVGRYAKDFAQITRERRAMRDAIAPFREVAKGDEAGRVLVELLETVMTQTLVPIVVEGADGLDMLQLQRLASSVRNTVGSRIASARELRDAARDAREQMRAQAADAAEKEARAAGASEETIARVKARILGLEEAPAS